MSSQVNCDICGRRIATTPFCRITKPKIIRYGDWMSETSFDVCNNCWKKFEEFVKENE